MTVAPVVVDASSGAHLTLSHTLSTSVTMANPIGGREGQKILFRLTQGGRGSSLITWDSAYDFSAGLALPVLKNAPGDIDLLGFMYDATKAKWVYVARGDHYGVLLTKEAWAAARPEVCGTAGRTPRGAPGR